jgi:hypothetical protein
LFAPLHIKDTINAGGNKVPWKESGFWPKTPSPDELLTGISFIPLPGTVLQEQD